MTGLNFKKRVVKSDDGLKEEILGKPRYLIEFYKNREPKPFFAAIQKPEDALVAKHSLAALFFELEAFGHIQDYDDLAKLIEKNRLAEQKSTA